MSLARNLAVTARTVIGALAAKSVVTSADVDASVNAKLSGDVVQVQNTQTGAVATTSVVMPFDDTIPQQVGEGAEFMTCAITPTNAANKLRVDVVFNGSPSTTSYVTAALFKNSDPDALAVGSNYAGGGHYVQTVFTFFMTAGTTSPITFRVRAGQHTAGTLTFNGDGGARRLAGIMFSSITVTEIRA